MELEGAEDGGRAVNLRDHVRAVAVNSRGTTDFITHYPMCVVPPVAANLVWGTPPSEFHHVGRRHYLSFLNQEPLHVGEEDVPKERLMKEPGLQCLADLLVKGANWLHDERDVRIPTLFVAPFRSPFLRHGAP